MKHHAANMHEVWLNWPTVQFFSLYTWCFRRQWISYFIRKDSLVEGAFLPIRILKNCSSILDSNPESFFLCRIVWEYRVYDIFFEDPFRPKRNKQSNSTDSKWFSNAELTKTFRTWIRYVESDVDDAISTRHFMNSIRRQLSIRRVTSRL